MRCILGSIYGKNYRKRGCKVIEENRIRAYLRKYIQCGGINNYIIYPFGTNGVKVRNILKDYYGVEPILVVDNECAKYNSEIVDFETLKKQYDGSAYIILTVEDKEINEYMLKELQGFVSLSHIINIKNLKDGLADLSHFRIQGFLQDIMDNGLESRQNILLPKGDHKIKVRFVSRTSSTWNAIETICLSFRNDDRFDVLIILGENMDENALLKLKEYGLSSISPDMYCVQEDLPDILIVNHPYDTMTQIEDCRANCKLIIAASMQLVRYGYDLKEFWDLQEKGFGRFQPDYYIFDSLLYNEIKRSGYASPKIIEMGNAKFDGIYEACKEKNYKEDWQKLRGKKVILWATDHGISRDHISKDVTFDLYAKTIIQYAKNNQEIGIIFRPHSAFVKEMLEYGLWSKGDLHLLKKIFRKSGNLVFDDSNSYDYAYSVADGIITDAFCGISCSALPTLKPVCLAYRSKSDLPYHQELADCYDSAYNSNDIIKFMDKIKDGRDTDLELRKEACNRYIKHFDGRNGWRIKEFITEKYLEKIETSRRKI
ncbi:MAG: hypothetical protein HFI04_00355 [Lachnospiraceae bacterium]|nr:hypothetical protein [Lachnospiraceae bacterium]